MGTCKSVPNSIIIFMDPDQFKYDDIKAHQSVKEELEQLALTFRLLHNQLRTETGHWSGGYRKHEAFQAIVQLGKDAIPFLSKIIQTTSDTDKYNPNCNPSWCDFQLLATILNYSPVIFEHRGKYLEVISDWSKYLRSLGL